MANDFIEDYLTYTEPLEVPTIFNLWCSLSALSAAAQRKIWIELKNPGDVEGLFKLAPNLYVVLDADPGVGKDTAMNIVRELLVHIPQIKTKSDSITKEKIYESMEGAFTKFDFPDSRLKTLAHCSLTVFATEMSLLIKRHDKDFVSALNALYNCLSVFKHSTKTRGENIILCPYLTILGGTTPDWVSANIQEDVIEGGLTARTIMIFSNDRSQTNPWPGISVKGMEIRARLIARLEKILGLGGQFEWTNETRKLYSDWYHEHRSQLVKNPVMRGFHTRKPVHIVKVAMLLSLSYKDELVLEPGDFLGAKALIDKVEPSVERALRGAGRNVLNVYAEEMLEVIASAPNGQVNLVELLQLFRWKLGRQDFMEVLESLKNMNLVKGETVGDKVFVKYNGDGRKQLKG